MDELDYVPAGNSTAGLKDCSILISYTSLSDTDARLTTKSGKTMNLYYRSQISADT